MGEGNKNAKPMIKTNFPKLRGKLRLCLVSGEKGREDNILILLCLVYFLGETRKSKFLIEFILFFSILEF